MRRWITALFTLALVLSLGAVGHAAELSLSSPRPPSLAMAERCDAQAAVEIEGTTWRSPLTVSGIPAACGGLPLSVWLYDSGATEVVTTQVPNGGGTVAVPVTRVTVGPHTAALATIDTWPLSTTMDIHTPFVSCRTPGTPAAGCSVEVVNDNDWPGHWQKTMRISTTSRSPVTWELLVNLSDPSVPVHPTRYLTHTGGLALISFAGCDTEPRTLIAGGSAGWHNQQVSTDTPRDVQVEGSYPLAEPASRNMLFLCE